MDTKTAESETKGQSLTINDRCDANCDAQAYVKVTGVTGELLFCAHHYTKIINNPLAASAMEKFAFKTVDEREFLYV